METSPEIDGQSKGGKRESIGKRTRRVSQGQPQERWRTHEHRLRSKSFISPSREYRTTNPNYHLGRQSSLRPLSTIRHHPTSFVGSPISGQRCKYNNADLGATNLSW